MRKILIAIMAVYTIAVTQACAENAETLPLLNGVKVTYIYQNGWAARVELKNGMLMYEWVAGPRTGKRNKDLPYRARKIGEHMYIVNWLEEAHPDFVTLIFNFKDKVMYSSGILRFATEKQSISFSEGAIQKLEYTEPN